MKVFVNDLSVPLHAALADYVDSKGYEVVASVPTQADASNFKYTVAASTDLQAVTKLMLTADIIVLSLLTKATKEVDELITVLTYMELEERKHLILLSSLLAWARVERPTCIGGGGGAAAAPLEGATPGGINASNNHGHTMLNEAFAQAPPPPPPSVPAPAPLKPGTGGNQASGREGGGGRGSIGGGLGAMFLQEARVKFSEDDYLRRRPAVSWTELKVLESQVLSGSLADRMHTCVVGAGLVYDEEGRGPLMEIFREAWFSGFNPVTLPTYRSGANVLPTIYQPDLLQLIYALLRSGGAFPKPYIIASDKGMHTLTQITTSLSLALGSGTVQPCTRHQFQDMLLDKPHFAELQMDLGFLSLDGSAMDGLIESGALCPSEYYQAGIAAKAQDIAQGFKKCYQLPVVKVVVLGVPGGGKSWLAKKLAQRYRLPVLGQEDAVRLAATMLPDGDGGGGGGEGGGDDEVVMVKKAAAEAMKQAPGGAAVVADDTLVARCVRAVLATPTCAKKGYILDGVIHNPEQFKNIFTTRAYGVSSEPAVPPPELLTPLPDIAPTHVVVLEAGDDVIASRCQQPEGMIGEAMAARLAAYRKPSYPPYRPGWEPPPQPKAAAKGKNASQPPPLGTPETLPQVAEKALGKAALVVHVSSSSSDVDMEVFDWIEKDVGHDWVRSLRRLEGSSSTTTMVPGGGGGGGGGGGDGQQLGALTIRSFDRTVGGGNGGGGGMDGNGSSSSSAIVEGVSVVVHRPDSGLGVGAGGAGSGDVVIQTPEGSLPASEFNELEEESEVYRHYLMEMVMPVLASAMVDVKLRQSDDPIEEVAQACLRAGKKMEAKAEAEAYLLYRGAVAKGKAKFDEDMALAKALAEDD